MKEQSVITISDLEKGTDKTSHVLKRELNGSVVDLIADGKVMSAVRPEALAKINLNPEGFARKKGLILQELLEEIERLSSQNQLLTGKAKKLTDENQALTEQSNVSSVEIERLAGEINMLSGQLQSLSNETKPLPGKQSVSTDASVSLYAMNYIVAIIAVASIMTSLPNLLGFGISLPIFLMWHSAIQFLRGSSPADFEKVKGVFIFALLIIGICEIVFHWVGFNITLSDESTQVAQELFGVGKFGQSLFIALLFTFIQLTAFAINMRLKEE